MNRKLDNRPKRMTQYTGMGVKFLVVAAGCGLANASAPTRPSGLSIGPDTIPVFENPVVFPVGVGPFGIAYADIAGPTIGSPPDGYPDLAIANTLDGTVTVYLNSGDWSDPQFGFGSPITLELDPGDPYMAPIEVAFGPMNPQDLLPDLVVSARDGNAVYVFINDPSEPDQFRPATSFTDPNLFAPRGLVLADFDTDGLLDAATASQYSNQLTVLFNDGDGGFDDFVLVNEGIEGKAFDLVAGEFINFLPGGVDMVTVNYGASSISLIKNLGNRQFAAEILNTTCQPWDFISIATARFDAGLTDDLVMTETCCDVATVFSGNGFGEFTTDCTSDWYQLHADNPRASRWGVDTGLLNFGTKVDIAVALQKTDQVSVLLGNGNGTFKQPEPEKGYLYSIIPDPPPDPAPENPIFVLLVDLNQDGSDDIVTANPVRSGPGSGPQIGSISVLINKGP